MGFPHDYKMSTSDANQSEAVNLNLTVTDLNQKTVTDLTEKTIGKFDYLVEGSEVSDLIVFDLNDNKLKNINKALLSKMFIKLQTYIRSRSEDLISTTVQAPSSGFENDRRCSMCPLILQQLSDQTERRIKAIEESHVRMINYERSGYELEKQTLEAETKAENLQKRMDELSDLNTALRTQMDINSEPKMLVSNKSRLAQQPPKELNADTWGVDIAKLYSTVVQNKPPAAQNNKLPNAAVAMAIHRYNPADLTSARRPRETDGVFITRCQPGTSPEVIENFILRHTGYHITAIAQKTKYDWYSSFHVKCTPAEQITLLEGNFWPRGMLVKAFVVPLPPRKATPNVAAVVDTTEHSSDTEEIEEEA